MSKLDEMKQEIASLHQTIEQLTVQLGFSKGRDILYGEALDEIQDLRRQLNDEQKVRQIMRQANLEHVNERDAAISELRKSFLADMVDDTNEKHSLEDIVYQCVRRHQNMRVLLTETREEFERRMNESH